MVPAAGVSSGRTLALLLWKRTLGCPNTGIWYQPDLLVIGKGVWHNLIGCYLHTVPSALTSPCEKTELMITCWYDDLEQNSARVICWGVVERGGKLSAATHTWTRGWPGRVQINFKRLFFFFSAVRVGNNPFQARLTSWWSKKVMFQTRNRQGFSDCFYVESGCLPLVQVQILPCLSVDKQNSFTTILNPFFFFCSVAVMCSWVLAACCR